MADVVVGIDFISSGSGFAYAFTNNKDEIILGKIYGNNIEFKVSTEIILDDNNNTIKFGSECIKYLKEKGLEIGHYFKEIKKILYEKKTEIKAYNSRKVLPLILVIQRILEKLKELAIDEIKRQRPYIKNNNIKYVVPIPVFLDESQKNIMIEASINAGLIKKEDDKSLFFPLESKVIEYYCLYNKCIDQNLMKVYNNSIICDLSGIAGNIIENELSVVGKTFFEDIIFKIFDCKDFNTYYNKCKKMDLYYEDGELLDNWKELERRVMKFIDSTNREKISDYYPINLYLFEDIFNEETDLNILVDKYNKSINDKELKLKIKNKKWWIVEFPCKIIYNYIKNHVDYIYEIVYNVLKYNEGINSIILVGHKYYNETLIQEMNEQLSNRISYFLEPSEPSLSIIEGAVLFGLNPNKIVQSKASCHIWMSPNNEWTCSYIENSYKKSKPNENYEIKKEFGKGGFGNIFLAYDKYEKREVVIKKIDKNKIKEEIFKREIKTMKEIKCDYSVEIYDYYFDNNYYYIVMEKCDGDLYNLLENKKKFSESEIKTIFLQLNIALKKMYSKRIIHRDLKPENIFIKYISSNKTDFIVKLGDFGLSREYQQRQFSTNNINPIYTAPEIQMARCEGKNYDPIKCDLWSIGLIIYKLKFYDIPYYAFFGGKIPNKFDNKNLNDLVEKLIVVEPEKRINWEDYFNHPFFR